jgi:hypothetical protein
MPYTVFLRRRFDDTVFIIYTPVIEAGISFYIRIVEEQYPVNISKFRKR